MRRQARSRYGRSSTVAKRMRRRENALYLFKIAQRLKTASFSITSAPPS
jgi:hypothetical protein